VEALKLVIEKESPSKKIAHKKNELETIYNQLVTEEGTYMQPMLEDQASYLSSMLGQADQKPGQDAYERLEELKAWFERVKAGYAGVVK
jgi:hypothetical protein